MGGSGGGLPALDGTQCKLGPDAGEDPSIASAAASAFDPKYVDPTSGSIEEDKAFPLATLLGADAARLADLLADPTLAKASSDRDARLRGAGAKCGTDVACLSGELAWSDADRDAAAHALTTRLAATNRLSAIAKSMRSSGRFALHAKDDDGALVEHGFVDLVAALGATLASESAAIGGAKLHDVVASIAQAHVAPLAFFEPLLLVDLAALEADQRDEATRYEPLAAGENAKALARIPSIAWSDYPFTVIVVPGRGPDAANVPLDPGGQLRADLAVQRFLAKVAPLVLLSGGHVHPDRTKYSEAIEMKRYLVATYAIPEDALLVDPHARHTTTNLRNASRLLYRYGVPIDRPALVTTDLAQAIYFATWDGALGPRCAMELGYLPWRALVGLSPNDACLLPVAVSLYADGRDPLDP